MTIFGVNNLEVHISGKKHATNLRTLGVISFFLLADQGS
jgi:hypothetical protein